MQLEIKQAVEVLERTPAVVDAMFRSQSKPWLQCRIKPRYAAAVGPWREYLSILQ